MAAAECVACISVKSCPFEGKCAFSALWQRAKTAVFKVYDDTTLQDLLDDNDAGQGVGSPVRRLNAPLCQGVSMQGLTKMGKGFTRHINKLFLLSGLLLLTALLVSLAIAMQEQPGLDSGRADIVTIDGLKAFGPLERPPVIFLHDKHTEALAKEKKDCLACHLKGEKYLSLKYQRTEDTDKQAVMDTYHEGCISLPYGVSQGGQTLRSGHLR